MNLSLKKPSCEFLSQEDNIESENYFLASSIGSLSLLWLLLSGLFSLVESMKLHAPSVFNDLSWLNYGRVHHASQLCFLGALIQGFLWVTFSQIVIAGQYLTKSKTTIQLSSLFFNFSIFVGIIEILSGNVNNATLIFPLYSLTLFTIALFLLIPPFWSSFLKIQKLSPTLLFIALSFWVLPFSLITTLFLAWGGFLHGAYGAWVLSWFSHHLISLFLFPLGLAALIHYTQQISQKKIQNLAPLRFSFWIYAVANLLTSSDLTGTPLTFLPAWLRALDTVGALFTSFSIIILLHSLYHHLKPNLSSLKKDLSFGFFGFALVSLTFLTFLKSLLAFREIEKWVQFTTLTNALQTLLYFGFLLMILFACIYHQAPLQLRRVWASTPLIQTHFWFSSLATGLTFFAFIVAGGLQVYRNSNAEIPFLSTVIMIRPLLWMQSLSLVFQFSGILMLALLFLLLLLNWKPNPKNSMFSNPT